MVFHARVCSSSTGVRRICRDQRWFCCVRRQVVGVKQLLGPVVSCSRRQKKKHKVFSLVWFFFLYLGSTNTSGLISFSSNILDEIEIEVNRDRENTQATSSFGCDTEKVFSEADEGSVVSGVDTPTPVEETEMPEIRSAVVKFLDTVDLSEVFSRRPVVMKSVPHCVRGPFTTAMRIILQEIVFGHQTKLDKEHGRHSCCPQGCCCTGSGTVCEP